MTATSSRQQQAALNFDVSPKPMSTISCLSNCRRALADHRYVTTGGIIGIIFGILIGGAFLVVCVVKVYKAVTNNEQELLANDFVAFEHEFILAENSNSPTQA